VGDQATRSGSAGVRTSLGCGTLILIAIIVLLFSGRSEIDELQTEIRDLRTQVERLEAKIDSLNARLAPSATP
jgi:outer membrane murein-binding lipoprotein Lpp